MQLSESMDFVFVVYSPKYPFTLQVFDTRALAERYKMDLINGENISGLNRYNNNSPKFDEVYLVQKNYIM
jgi:hypothetical protein